MNPLVAGERFRYFGPDFDGSVIEIERQMASWSRESGRSNETTTPRRTRWARTATALLLAPGFDHSRRNRLSNPQFDLIVHTLFWLTSHVPPATADCHDSPPGKHWNDPKQIQPARCRKARRACWKTGSTEGKIVRLVCWPATHERCCQLQNCARWLCRHSLRSTRWRSPKHLPAECQCPK